MSKIIKKATLFWVLASVSLSAIADSGPGAFQSINQNATIDNVAANSQAFFGNLFEFFVNVGLILGIVVGAVALNKAKKISNGEDNASYASPLIMLAVSGALTSVWFVVFVLSNTIEGLAG